MCDFLLVVLLLLALFFLFGFRLAELNPEASRFESLFLLLVLLSVFCSDVCLLEVWVDSLFSLIVSVIFGVWEFGFCADCTFERLWLALGFRSEEGFGFLWKSLLLNCERIWAG